MPKNRARERLSGGGEHRYVKISEAAKHIGVHEITVRTMLADGRLTPYRLGPRILRVDLNEVDRVMAAGGADYGIANEA